MSDTNSIKFIYVRDARNTPIGCIAYRLDTNSHPVTVTYGLSTRHPNDKFSKTIAREVALGRLQRGLSMIESAVPSAANRNKPVNDVFAALLTNDKTPTRIRKAAERWLHTISTMAISPETP